MKPDRVIWPIAALALAVRLAFLLLSPPAPCEDCTFYDEVAWNVASGRGFIGGFASETFAGPSPLGHAAPEAGMGPTYPFFAAAIYAAAGHSPAAVGVAQAVAGAATVWLVYLIASSFGRRTALIAALLVAISPALVVHTSLLLTETVSAALLCLLVWIAALAIRRDGMLWAAGAGFVLGLATLARTECVLILPLVVGTVWWRGGPRRIAVALVLAAVSCATIGVWTVRNYRVFHKPILVSAAGGEVLWLSTKGWMDWRRDDPELRRLVEGQDYVGQNEVLGREALRNIRRDPLGYAVSSLRRIPAFWLSSHTTYVNGLSESFRAYADRQAYARLFAKGALLAFSVAIVALGALGIVVVCRSRLTTEALLALAVIATIAAVHVVLYASPRYQIAILPLVSMFAAAAIDRLTAGATPPKTAVPVHASEESPLRSSTPRRS
jgi:4-amino-4-deoxy-L-arabinose transferase-like glycosyltransferase